MSFINAILKKKISKKLFLKINKIKAKIFKIFILKK